jgi:hypothetical protein
VRTDGAFVELDQLDELGRLIDVTVDARSAPRFDASRSDSRIGSVTDVVEPEVVGIDERLVDRHGRRDRNLAGAVAVLAGPCHRAGAVAVAPYAAERPSRVPRRRAPPELRGEVPAAVFG